MAPPAGNDEAPEFVYGIHTVEEIIRAGLRPIQRIMLIRLGGQFTRITGLAKSRKIPLTIESRERMDRLVPYGRHQGVIGVVAAKAYEDEDALIAFAQQQSYPPFLLILDGVEDPQNFGAILRSAETAGVHGVIIPERRAVGLTPGVARASAGAVDYVRVARTVNIGKFIDHLKIHHIPTYAVTPAGEAVYSECNMRGPVALVLGAEGKGIRPGILKRCDAHIRIPMNGKMNSLNVSASAAVVLFEVVRQREQGRLEKHPT